MENIVTMNLEEYTALIKENCKLSEKLNGLRNNAIKRVREEIKDSLINRLTEEECVGWLSKDKKDVLQNFTNCYSWTFQKIADDVCVLTEEDVKSIFFEQIIKMINGRLNDLIEERKGGE